MSHWTAVGRSGAQYRAFAIENGRVTARAYGADETEALAVLSKASETIVRVGSGVAEKLPAPVLPASGLCLADWAQDKPRDLIPAWVRLSIAGFLASYSNWDGVICVSEAGVNHWIHISVNEAVSAQSFLTPRMIHMLGGGRIPDTDALENTLSRPERLAAQLHSAEIADYPDATTGHLIGAELAAARSYWLGQQVVLIGDTLKPYATALESQGGPCEVVSAELALEDGLVALGIALGLNG